MKKVPGNAYDKWKRNFKVLTNQKQALPLVSSNFPFKRNYRNVKRLRIDRQADDGKIPHDPSGKIKKNCIYKCILDLSIRLINLDYIIFCP